MGQGEQRGEGHGAQEVAAGRGDRIAGAAAEQGIDAPGGACRQHQQGGVRRRCREPRQQQADQARHRHHHAEQFRAAEAFACPQAVAHHGELHAAEQQQRAGRRGEVAVGEGEEHRIGRQHGRHRPASALRHADAAQSQDDEQDQGARGQAQRGEARRIDRRFRERDAAEQRIAGEGQHGKKGEKGGTQAGLRADILSVSISRAAPRLPSPFEAALRASSG